MHSETLRYPRPHTSEEIKNASVENGNPPRSNQKIHRNFDFFLPNFHFILPNFYFAPLWRIFVCSLEILNFLGKRVTVGTLGSV